jgi:hypothetical protein
MSLASAYDIIRNNLKMDVGRFYGTYEHLSLGAGLIYDGIRFPVYVEEDDAFVTLQGLVYVLSHECDAADENQRAFNDDVLISPIIKFEEFYTHLLESYDAGNQASFLGHLASRNISRLMYFPPLPPALPYGGVIFLNQITHTKVSQFIRERAKRIGALSQFGLREFDFFLTRHLLRPKDELLSLH